MRVPIQVLVYAVSRTRETPKVLLLRRTVRLGGFWQGVTGAPLDGESLNDAAIRELREETGFEDNRLVDLKFSYSFPVSDEYRHLYWYDVTEYQSTFFSLRCRTRRLNCRENTTVGVGLHFQEHVSS